VSEDTKKWTTQEGVQKLLEFGKLNEIALKIQEAIVDIFHNSGIYYRIFYRVKKAKSLTEKLNRGGYGLEPGEKRVQDIIGLRIVLYYGDDLSIGQKIMRDTFLMLGDWEKTETKEDQFAASKINGIFYIPEEFMINYKIPENKLPVQSVFELQFRTMFFEGWHEIEHDMRYKTHFADDTFWKGSPDLSRILNCIVANLELCDWSMLGLFDQLAEYHYKEKNWEMMLKSKFRLRMSEKHLSEEIADFFDASLEVAEQIYYCTRSRLIESLMGTVHGEITYDLLVRILNEKYVHNEELAEICAKQENKIGIKPFQPLPLQRLESSDVFCIDVSLKHRPERSLESELHMAAQIIQRWAKNKLADIFDDISEEPESYKRQTLGYQLITSYHERLLYYEMEMYHLDMEHPGTLWQMQVLIQRVKLSDEHLTLWVHSICRHPVNMSAAVVFSKPLFINEISAKIGLEDVEALKTTPITIETKDSYERLLHMISTRERHLPVVVLAASLDKEALPEEESGMGLRIGTERRQIRKKKGDFVGILHAGKLAHIIGMYAHVYLLNREYSEKFGEAVGRESREVFGSVSVFDCASGLEPSEFFTEEMILGSRFDYNKYVYYEGDVYEKAFRHKLVEMIKRKLLEKHPY
jgi:ppGpp synthetase/RelA/SpoT-type nucleotidyltranferase